jgi:hypothetical protein
VRERQRVTEGDQRRRLLRRHDAGQPRGLQRFALGHLAAPDLTKCGSAHRDLASRERFAHGDRLLPDVDHPHPPPGVDVRKRWRLR